MAHACECEDACSCRDSCGTLAIFHGHCLKIGSLTEPEARCVLAKPSNPSVSASQCWGYRHGQSCLAFHLALAIQTHVFLLEEQMLFLPIHLPFCAPRGGLSDPLLIFLSRSSWAGIVRRREAELGVKWEQPWRLLHGRGSGKEAAEGNGCRGCRRQLWQAKDKNLPNFECQGSQQPLSESCNTRCREKPWLEVQGAWGPQYPRLFRCYNISIHFLMLQAVAGSLGLLPSAGASGSYSQKKYQLEFLKS